MRAVGGGDHVAVLERAADPDGDRFLADRDVQEPGQLSRAKPLLDLLLEAPDQQHLAEELAQIRFRERAFLLHLRHEPQFMLRLLRLVDQFSELERGLADDWSRATPPAHYRQRGPARTRGRAARAGDPRPRGPDAALRRRPQRGPASRPRPSRRLLKRLDDERIEGELELARCSRYRREERRQKPTLREQWDAAARRRAARLERPVRRRCASTPPTTSSGPHCCSHRSTLHGSPDAATLRFRSAQQLRLRRVAADGGALLHALRRRGHHGRDRSPPRALRHAPSATQGPVWLLGGRTV